VLVDHAVIEPAIHHLVDLEAGMLRGVPGMERIESRCESVSVQGSGNADKVPRQSRCLRGLSWGPWRRQIAGGGGESVSRLCSHMCQAQLAPAYFLDCPALLEHQRRERLPVYDANSCEYRQVRKQAQGDQW